MTNDFMKPTTRRTVGLRDAPLVFLAPGRLFARVEDVTAYLWPLTVLMAALTLIGYATVETGLIDRLVDQRVEKQLEELEKNQVDVIARSALRKNIEDVKKEGEFFRLLTRIQVVAFAPLGVLGAVLLIAALLYGVVALTGRKPEWHALMTLGVFAAYIDLLRAFLALILMIRETTLEIDLTFGALAHVLPHYVSIPPESLPHVTIALSGIDPFAIWFWWTLCLGLRRTRQLEGWKAWTICILFWGVATTARVALVYAQTGAASWKG